MPSNKGEPITTRFSVDISELKAGIQEANRQIKLANSEFKAAASGMDDWSKSADGLSAKIQQLSSVQDAENKKLSLLKQQYEQVAAEQGESSVAAQNLMIRINNQQAAVNKTTAELNKYSQQLTEIQRAQEDSADTAEEQKSAYEALQDTISGQEKTLSGLKQQYANVTLEQGDSSDAAQTLAREIEALSSELADNRNKMNDAEAAADTYDRTLDDLGDSAEEAEGGFTILKGAVATFAGNILTSAAGAVKDFVGSLFDMSEATEEYRQMMAKVEGSASSFGYSIDFANEKYQEFYKYLGDDQMATNAITNLMGMRVSTETVSDVAEAAISVWSAYGDSIPIEGLTEAINESAQVGAVTGSLADTINWAARSNEDWSAAMKDHSAAQKAFNAAIADGEAAEDAYSAALAACADTQERADLIAQTLNQTYGSSKQTFDELSAGALAANEAELALKDTQAELGAAVEPVNTAIANLKAQALDALAPVIENVAGHFSNFLNWMVQTPGATQAVISVIAGLATSLGILAGALAIQTLINGVQKAFALLNVTMAANPFVLIATLIAGIATALITLWTTSEDFRNFWKELWDNLVSVVSKAVSRVKDFFTKTLPDAFNNFISFIKGNWQNIALFISNPFAGAFNLIYQHSETFRNFIDNLLNNILAMLENLFPGITDLVNNIFTAFKNRDWASLGKYLVQGIANGIISGAMFPINAVKSLATNVWNTFKKAMKINSPSKVAEESGKYIDQGLAQGIEKNEGIAKQSAKDLAKAVEDSLEINKSRFEKMLSGLTEALRKQLEKQKDLRLQSIEDELSAEEEASEKRLELYEKEYNEKVKALDDETNEQVKVLQDQIDAIEKAEEDRQRAQEEADYNSSVAALEDQIAAAETEEERAELQKELAETQAEWQEKLRQEELTKQKEALQAQIDAIKDNAEVKKEELEKQYDEQVSSENDRLDSVKKSLEEEQTYWEDYYEERLSDDSINAEARKLVLEKNQDEIVRLLETYNPQWQNAGQSLADSLLYGLESETQTTKDAVSQALDLTDVIVQQEAQLATLQAAADGVSESAKGAAGSVGSVGDAAAAINFPTEEFDTVQQEFSETDAAAEKSEGIFAKVSSGLQGAATTAATWMGTKFTEIGTAVSGFATSARETINGWVASVAQFFTEDIPNTIDSMVEFFAELPDRIAYWLGFALGRVTAWGIELFNWATTEIPKFINQIITFISTLPNRIWEWLSQAYNKTVEWGQNMVKTAREKMDEFVKGAIEFIQNLPSNAKDWLDKTIDNVIQWGSDMVEKAKSAASDTVNGIVTTLQELPGKVFSIGENVVKGIWDGITSMGDWLYNKVSGFVDSIIDGFTDGMEIESPSKVMKRLAKYIPEGVGEGITENAKLATEPVKALTNKIRQTASGLGGLKSSLSGQVVGIRQRVAGAASAMAQQAQATRNIVFNQYNNSPKALSRLEIYRQSKNLLRGATAGV